MIVEAIAHEGNSCATDNPFGLNVFKHQEFQTPMGVAVAYLPPDTEKLKPGTEVALQATVDESLIEWGFEELFLLRSSARIIDTKIKTESGFRIHPTAEFLNSRLRQLVGDATTISFIDIPEEDENIRIPLSQYISAVARGQFPLAAAGLRLGSHDRIHAASILQQDQRLTNLRRAAAANFTTEVTGISPKDMMYCTQDQLAASLHPHTAIGGEHRDAAIQIGLAIDATSDVFSTARLVENKLGRLLLHALPEVSPKIRAHYLRYTMKSLDRHAKNNTPLDQAIEAVLLQNPHCEDIRF